MSEPCTRRLFRQKFTASAENGRAGAPVGTSERQTSYPAQVRAGTPGSSGAGHALDSAGVVRCHDRRDGQNRLLAHGAEAQDERNQGEHLNLKILIAAAQHLAAKWLRETVATNAIGSIVIAENERAVAFSGPAGVNRRPVRHG